MSDIEVFKSQFNLKVRSISSRMVKIGEYDISSSDKGKLIDLELEQLQRTLLGIFSTHFNKAWMKAHKDAEVKGIKWIVDGECKKEEISPDVICNIGYACDGCPYNKR